VEAVFPSPIKFAQMTQAYLRYLVLNYENRSPFMSLDRSVPKSLPSRSGRHCFSLSPTMAFLHTSALPSPYSSLAMAGLAARCAVSLMVFEGLRLDDRPFARLT